MAAARRWFCSRSWLRGEDDGCGSGSLARCICAMVQKVEDGGVAVLARVANGVAAIAPARVAVAVEGGHGG